MAAPNSRQTLIEYSLRQLGAPVVDINVDWQQCEDRLDDALQATKAALEEGVLPGAGVALLHAREAVTQAKTDGVDYSYHSIEI